MIKKQSVPTWEREGEREGERGRERGEKERERNWSLQKVHNSRRIVKSCGRSLLTYEGTCLQLWMKPSWVSYPWDVLHPSFSPSLPLFLHFSLILTLIAINVTRFRKGIYKSVPSLSLSRWFLFVFLSLSPSLSLPARDILSKIANWT